MKRLVRIVWRDAQDHPMKWVDEEDAEKFCDETCVIVSVGFVVRETEKYFTLAGDWDDADKDFGRVTKIPVGTIQSVDELVVLPGLPGLPVPGLPGLTSETA